MNESFSLTQSQERELLCSIYEYFLWRKDQEKEKEKTAKKSSSSAAKEQKLSNNNDYVTPEYFLYQSVIDFLQRNFSKYESDFTSTKITQRIPRLIKALFVDNLRSHPQTNQKAPSSGKEYNELNHRPKLKRKIDKENKPELPKAKKKSRVSVSSPADTNAKTTLTDATSTTVCDNTKNDDIDSVKDKKKLADSETLENLPTQKETPATSSPTIDSNEDNDHNTPGAASNASDSKSEKRRFPSFEERFKELEHFKAGNGHTRVPVRTVLGHWVSKIRGKKRSMDQGKPCDGNPLSEEQIDRLDSLGFEWNVAPTPLPFEQRFEELVKFKEIEAHCDVPRSYENDPSLGEWVHLMRTNYAKKRNYPTTEQIKKLENLGFNWVVGPKKKTFEERLEECRTYRRQHGHLNVPPLRLAPRIQTKEEESFINWANTQRKEYKRWNAGLKSRLNKSRINKLDEIGFDWTYGNIQDYKPKPYVPRKPKEKETWEGRLQELKELKEKVGSCNSRPDFEKAGYTEQSRLYQWAKLQRKYWKINKLSEEQVNKLKELDFDFQPRRHYAPYGSKKAAAEAQKTKESKDEQNPKSEDDCESEDDSTGNCARNDDETASESDNYERKKGVQLQTSVEKSADSLFRGFGNDTCRL